MVIDADYIAFQGPSIYTLDTMQSENYNSTSLQLARKKKSTPVHLPKTSNVSGVTVERAFLRFFLKRTGHQEREDLKISTLIMR